MWCLIDPLAVVCLVGQFPGETSSTPMIYSCWFLFLVSRLAYIVVSGMQSNIGYSKASQARLDRSIPLGPFGAWDPRQYPRDGCSLLAHIASLIALPKYILT